jgi:hypothetical protein
MRRRIARSITVAVGALFFCSIAPISAEAKTDLSKCEDRCRDYDNCAANPNVMYCHYACRKKMPVLQREKKHHAAFGRNAVECETKMSNVRQGPKADTARSQDGVT